MVMDLVMDLVKEKDLVMVMVMDLVMVMVMVMDLVKEMDSEMRLVKVNCNLSFHFLSQVSYLLYLKQHQ